MINFYIKISSGLYIPDSLMDLVYNWYNDWYEDMSI